MSVSDERAELARHLADLIGSRLLDPLEILLAADLVEVRERIATQSATMASLLLGDDEQAAALTAIRLVAALYPGDEPFRPATAWWGTPLGRNVARLVGHPSADPLSYAEAGAILGISRQGVHDLVVRGKLERHPSGGVTNTSVRARSQKRFADARRAQQEDKK